MIDKDNTSQQIIDQVCFLIHYFSEFNESPYPPWAKLCECHNPEGVRTR